MAVYSRADCFRSAAGGWPLLNSKKRVWVAYPLRFFAKGGAASSSRPVLFRQELLGEPAEDDGKDDD